MDNLGAHKVAGVAKAIKAIGASVLYLPPYLPDLNPIEQAFAKLKALLRGTATRTKDALWATTLAPLPAYSPELNPVERVWLHLREHCLSHRVLNTQDEIVTACCDAWNSLTPDRLRSLCNHPWIAQITS